MTMYRVRFLLLLGMTAAAAASRVLPHPPNVTPIAAVALLGGARFADRRAAFVVPLGAMLASDLVLGMLHRNLGLVFDPMLLVIYGCFATTVCLGFLLRRHRGVLPIAAATLAASILFFVASNLGVWALGTLYPRTRTGLLECFVAALPFFRNTVLGDAMYAVALFGGLALAERGFPALRDPLCVAPAGGSRRRG
jgi:hypothetical protein